MDDNKKEVTIDQLKEEALLLGISFKGNISKDRLQDMITGARQTQKEPVGSFASDVMEANSDDELFDEVFNDAPTRGDVKEAKKQALTMLMVRITNLNSEELEEQTVYAGVVNNYFKAARYIPLDKPWAVEQCLVDKLLTEKFQTFVNEIDPRTRRPNGNKVAKLTKHYNVQFV